MAWIQASRQKADTKIINEENANFYQNKKKKKSSASFWDTLITHLFIRLKVGDLCLRLAILKTR